jgi:hypothetical protein
LIVLLVIVGLVVTGPISKIGKIKSTKFEESVEPRQEFDFNKDTLPIHNVVSLG